VGQRAATQLSRTGSPPTSRPAEPKTSPIEIRRSAANGAPALDAVDRALALLEPEDRSFQVDERPGVVGTARPRPLSGHVRGGPAPAAADGDQALDAMRVHRADAGLV
jgi:hypothetical protein